LEERKRYQRPLGGRTLKRWVLRVLFFGICALGLQVDARAESEDERARYLFDNGHQLYMEGRYEDALAAWTEAYDLSRRPLILYNMANAYERNGQVRKAISVLNRYRAYAQPDEQEVILRRIKNMEHRLTLIQPPQASVAVQEPLQPFPTAEVALLGTGAIAIVSGVLLGSGAKNQGTQAALYCGGQGLPCTSMAADFLKKERRYALGADLCFIAGGLATATGIGLLVLKKSDTSSPETVRVQVSPSATGLVMNGTF